MTPWATMLIPAGSVVVGAAIAGGTAIGGQVFTHRGSSQREREARRDAFKVARFEIERETLLSLQEALLEHVKLVAHIMDLGELDELEDAANKAEDVVQSELRIVMLTSRCLAREAVEAVETCLKQCKTIVQTLDQRLSPAPKFERAQELLGAALRKNPFEGER